MKKNSIAEQTLEMCRANGIKPAKSKGQNFLLEEKYYEQIVSAAELSKTDQVLEIGPGLGFLTVRLAEAAGQVTAVELDRKLAELLKIRLKKDKVANVSVMEGNALDLMIGQEGQARYKVVANLPYNITSAFLRKFLSRAKNKPELLVLLLQKEVAERICAKKGEMSLLAVSVQAYAQAEIIGLVPAKAFYPAPEVESAIIRIRTLPNGLNPEQEKPFFQLVRIGFSARRKKLANNLVAGFKISQQEAVGWLSAVGLTESIRAQELSLADWSALLLAKPSALKL